MTSVIILSTDRNLGRQCASEVADIFTGDSNDDNQLVIVKRNLRLRSTQQNEQNCQGELSHIRSHRMDHFKEIYSGMEVDNDYSTGDGEPRMKRLKSNPAPSTSHAYGTDSGINGGVQETDERTKDENMRGMTVDVYMFTLEDNFALVLEKTKSCIPNGLIIVPVPKDISKESEAKIERVLKSILDDVTVNWNKSVPRIVFVSMQSGAKNYIPGKGTISHKYQLVRSKDRCECSLGELRHKVYELLSQLPQCLEVESYDDLFVPEDALPSDQREALLIEKKIIQFEVSEKNECYVCTCPADLTAKFSQGTQRFKDCNVNSSELLSEINIQSSDEPVILAALAALGLICLGNKSISDVYIVHLLSSGEFDLHSLCINVTPQPTALHFMTDCVVDKKKILVSCVGTGWKIKEARGWNNNGHGCVPDVFLLKKDRLAVLMWYYNSKGTNIYICVVNNLNRGDREREHLETLRLCVQKCFGSEIKSSICCSYSSESNDNCKADGFIQDIVNNSHCEWIAANDPKLYYLLDALHLLCPWIKPSKEGELKQKLKKSMDGPIISKLSAKFGRDTELFFIEQRVDDKAVNRIKSDNNNNFKKVVMELLIEWRSFDGSNLYTLRKAVERDTEHSDVIFIPDFDKIVEDFWSNEPRDNLI